MPRLLAHSSVEGGYDIPSLIKVEGYLTSEGIRCLLQVVRPLKVDVSLSFVGERINFRSFGLGGMLSHSLVDSMSMHVFPSRCRLSF
jgi:hypothetical protein